MARSTEKRGVRKKIREILGASPRASLDSRALSGATRSQLLQIGRLLGLRATSRLRKAELVEHVERALRAEPSPRGTTEAATGTALSVQESSAGPSEEPAPSVPSTAAPRGWSPVELQARRFSPEERSPPSLASAPRAPMPEHIPWGYGRTRVGALPVDPDRLFVYWEMTDEAIEEARRALGPGAHEAWLNLRVYDTTGRLFDGTNAHSYFDQGIGNETRQWFFDIGRPGSEAFVEIGLRSPDGGFRKVARSRRVAFPRRSPASYREPEWLTVRASSVGAPVVPHSSRAPLASTSASQMPESELRTAPGREADAGWNASERVFHSDLGPSTEVVERRIELSEERIETLWQGPISTTEWESEPFSVSLDVLYGGGPVWETYAGETRTFQVDGRTHVVFGPWQVVVRGIGAHGGRRVLSRWMVYRSWAVEGQGELLSTGVWSRTLGSSAFLGGSERRFGAASELRLSGASELLYRGASERRLGGASERVYAAASERLMRGASERRFRGASERRLGGASERVYAGASEKVTKLAKLMRGASERRFGGASERFPSPTRSTGPDEGGNR